MSRAQLTTAEVVVAGAGVAGSAVAFELAKRGVRVLLLERGAAGPAGASTVPAALINPHRGRSGKARPQDVAGATAFWALIQDLEASVGPSGAHRSGVLRLADNARQARNWQKLVGTVWLEPGEVPPEYHAPFGAMLVPGGGWLRSAELLTSLAAGVRAAGGRVLHGAELVGVEPRIGAERATGAVATALTVKLRQAGAAGLGAAGLGAAGLGASSVDPAATRYVTCRALIVATGAWQPAELRLPRLELVWGEARTLALGFTPSLPLTGSVAAAFHDGLAFVSGGHRHVGWLGEQVSWQGNTAAGAGHDGSHEPLDAVATSSAAEEPSRSLQHALAWQVPAAAGAHVVGHWEGVRAKRPSGEPVVRRVAPGVHLLAAFGGRGFLRAAAAATELADRLARELTAG